MLDHTISSSNCGMTFLALHAQHIHQPKFLCICAHICVYMAISSANDVMMSNSSTGESFSEIQHPNFEFLQHHNIAHNEKMIKYQIYDAPISFYLLRCTCVQQHSCCQQFSNFFFNPSITVQHHMKYVNFLSVVFRRSLVVFFSVSSVVNFMLTAILF